MNNEAGVITCLANGMNLKSKFEYKPLTDTAVYKNTGHLRYPLSTLTFPLYVVNTMKVYNGRQYETITHKYQDVIAHKQGKGILGFGQTTTTNVRKNISSVTKTEFDNTYFILSKQTVESFLGGDTLSKSITTNFISPIEGKRIFVYPGTRETRDALKNINIVTNSEYDNTGNLVRQTTSFNSDFYNESKVFSGFDKFGNPSSIIANAIRSGEPIFTQSHLFTYTEKGKVKSATANGLTTTYSYDAFGNNDTITVGTGAEARKTTNKFSNDGRFLVQQTNSMEHISGTSFNVAGSPAIKTDANGLNVINTYDSWNNLVETHSPDGRISKSNLDWVSNGDPYAPTGSVYYSKSENDGLFAGAEYFDNLGREVRKVISGYKGAKYYIDSWYYITGELKKTSEPYPEGGAALKFTSWTYDEYGRVQKEILPNGVSATYTYEDVDNKVTVTNSTGEVYTKKYDITGQLISSSDPGGTVNYNYTSSGKVRYIQSPNNVTELKYDEFARQDTLIDSDAGTFTYGYNIFGELALQIDAKRKTSSLVYDKLGRIKSKTVDTITTAYEYDLGTKALGTLSSVSKGKDDKLRFEYSAEGLCRLMNESKQVGDRTFINKYEYDSKGRLTAFIYPSGLKVRYVYNNYNELEEIQNENGNNIWKIDEINATNGMLQKATYGNGRQITYSYDNFDRLNQISVPGIIDFKYQFNNKQQLDWREEKYYYADSSEWKGFKEEFTYDEANRLKTARGGVNLTMQYSGSLLKDKSDVGSYTYENGNHRLEELGAVTGYLPAQHNLTFTSEGRVATISELTDSTTSKLFSFNYGWDDERVSMEYYLNDTLRYTRYYLGNFEKEVKRDGTERNINYIYAPNGLVAVFDQTSEGDSMYYVYTDYLGSLRCITNDIGTVKQRLSYDAWGNRRNPVTGERDSTIADSLLFARGYTGHEHLDEMGLINMNARIYDPALGMFISPDNYVDSENSQDFNRYTYCLNNPLMYTDPTGNYEFPKIEIPPITIPTIDFSKFYTPTNNSYNNYYNWFNYASQNNYSYGYNSSYGSNWGGYGSYGGYTYSYSTGYNTTFGAYSYSYVSGYSITQGSVSFYSSSYYYSASGGSASNSYSFSYSRDISYGSEMSYTIPNISAITHDVNSLIQTASAPKRMYGGDGSGSFLDWSCYAADIINQYNPIANLWDYGTYLFTGKDRLGNSMSVTEGSLKGLAGLPALGWAGQGAKEATKGTITLASKYALRKAAVNPALTRAEAAAAINYPRVAPMMYGKGVDRAFRFYANKNLILRPADAIGLIKINPVNKGADIVGGWFLKHAWWDVTTAGSWGSHVAKYGPGGIGLFYILY